MSENKEKTLTIRVPDVSVSLEFRLSNLFNVRSLIFAPLSIIGVQTASNVAWAFEHMNFIGMGGMTPMSDGVYWSTVAGAGLAGLWNAHAVGGQTVFLNNPVANAIRNAFLMTTAALGAATLGGAGASLATGNFNAALVASGLAALAAATGMPLP